jgi:phosphohistidine phosphatase
VVNLSSAAVRLFLVRHAHSAPGEPDSLRPLSEKGREQARALGERLASVSPDAVFTSPLLRARETATAIARAADLEPQSDERLAPGATAEVVLAVAEGGGETVVVVGHQPDCSEIAAELGAGEHDFAPAGFLEIDRA